MSSRWGWAVTAAGLLIAGCASTSSAPASTPSEAAPEAAKAKKPGDDGPATAGTPEGADANTPRAAHGDTDVVADLRAVVATEFADCENDMADEVGLIGGMCADEQFMWLAITDAVENPRLANVDALLTLVREEGDEGPAPKMERLDLGAYAAHPVYVFEHGRADGGDEDITVYIVDYKVRAPIKMALCGWTDTPSRDDLCRRVLAAALK